MSLPEQADNATGLINYHREETGNVSAQHAYLERFQFGNGSILPPKNNLAFRLTTEPNLSFDNDRFN